MHPCFDPIAGDDFNDEFFAACADYVWSGLFGWIPPQLHNDRRFTYLSGGPLDNQAVA